METYINSNIAGIKLATELYGNMFTGKISYTKCEKKSNKDYFVPTLVCSNNSSIILGFLPNITNGFEKEYTIKVNNDLTLSVLNYENTGSVAHSLE